MVTLAVPEFFHPLLVGTVEIEWKLGNLCFPTHEDRYRSNATWKGSKRSSTTTENHPGRVGTWIWKLRIYLGWKMLANENECYFMGIHVLEGCSDAIFPEVWALLHLGPLCHCNVTKLDGCWEQHGLKKHKQQLQQQKAVIELPDGIKWYAALKHVPPPPYHQRHLMMVSGGMLTDSKPQYTSNLPADKVKTTPSTTIGVGFNPIKSAVLIENSSQNKGWK